MFTPFPGIVNPFLLDLSRLDLADDSLLLGQILAQLPELQRVVERLYASLSLTHLKLGSLVIESSNDELCLQVAWAMSRPAIRRAIETAYRLKLHYLPGLICASLSDIDEVVQDDRPDLEEFETDLSAIMGNFPGAWGWLMYAAKLNWPENGSPLHLCMLSLEYEWQALAFWELMQVLSIDRYVSALRMHFGKTFFVQGVCSLGAYDVGADNHPEVQDALSLAAYFMIDVASAD